MTNSDYETACEQAAMAAICGLPAWQYLELALFLRGGITDDSMVSRAVAKGVLSDVADCVEVLLREDLLPRLQAAVPEIANEIEEVIDGVVHEFAAGIEERLALPN